MHELHQDNKGFDSSLTHINDVGTCSVGYCSFKSMKIEAFDVTL